MGPWLEDSRSPWIRTTTTRKRIFYNEDTLRGLWDNLKYTNIHTMGVWEGEERKWQKTSLKKNSLSQGKETYTGPGSTENPKREEPKVIHINTNKPQLKWQKLKIMRKFGRQQGKWVPYQCSAVHSLSRVRLFATPWIAARQASLSITNSRSSLRLNIHRVVRWPSSHLILCRPLFLLPPIPGTLLKL